MNWSNIYKKGDHIYKNAYSYLFALDIEDLRSVKFCSNGVIEGLNKVKGVTNRWGAERMLPKD